MSGTELGFQWKPDRLGIPVCSSTLLLIHPRDKKLPGNKQYCGLCNCIQNDNVSYATIFVFADLEA